MNFEKIKEFLNNNERGKVLIIEDGEPTSIIISYGEYQELKGKKPLSSKEKETPKEPSPNEITLDDLPV